MHGYKDAQLAPKVFSSVVNDLIGIIRTLRETPYDDTRSMLDVTTFAVSSEFSRTMRQYGNFETSGTDHNPLTNSVILGGKGIKKGRVWGASDFQTTNEELSPLHLSFDRNRLKAMGKPFEHATGEVISNLVGSDTYDPSLFLTASNIMNSIYDLFKVEKTKYRLLGRNKPEATVVRTFLE